MSRLLRAWPLALTALVCACAPTFKPTGSLTIDGASFTPVRCQVLTRGGIELADARGARLELSLPPARLDAWKDISGNPTATYAPSGGTAVVLGACGSLTLTGEGYHGSGKRAASGTMSLDCAGGVTVKGDLSFTGCF